MLAPFLIVFRRMFNGFWLDFGWALEGFCKDIGNVFGGGPKDASDVYSFSLAACWEFKLYWGVLLSFPVLANYRYSGKLGLCQRAAGARSPRRDSRGEESEEGGERYPM